MMIKFLLPLLGCLVVSQVQADIQARQVAYELDGKAFEGTLVYDDSVDTVRPGLLMVPNWKGPTRESVEKAKRVASNRYAVFVADMYGVDVRPKNAEEAAAAAGFVRKDRALMRKRAAKALEVLKAQKSQVKIDDSSIGAIGFCFGGGAVLELARSGASLGGVVSFHGNLDTPDVNDAKQIAAKVLVLHGADDPSVPKVQVDAFIKEMTSADVDWQLMMFGNAVHSFTDPTANTPGKSQYNPVVAQRAFTLMNEFFDEVFQAKR